MVKLFILITSLSVDNGFATFSTPVFISHDLNSMLECELVRSSLGDLEIQPNDLMKYSVKIKAICVDLESSDE